MDIKIAVELSGRAYVENLRQPRTKIEVTKGARGEYRWTVEVSDPVPGQALRILENLEVVLARQYGVKEEASDAG